MIRAFAARQESRVRRAEASCAPTALQRLTVGVGLWPANSRRLTRAAIHKSIHFLLEADRIIAESLSDDVHFLLKRATRLIRFPSGAFRTARTACSGPVGTVLITRSERLPIAVAGRNGRSGSPQFLKLLRTFDFGHRPGSKVAGLPVSLSIASSSLGKLTVCLKLFRHARIFLTDARSDLIVDGDNREPRVVAANEVVQRRCHDRRTDEIRVAVLLHVPLLIPPIDGRTQVFMLDVIAVPGIEACVKIDALPSVEALVIDEDRVPATGRRDIARVGLEAPSSISIAVVVAEVVVTVAGADPEVVQCNPRIHNHARNIDEPWT